MDHVMHDPCYASQAYLSQNISAYPCLSQNIAQLIWLCACIPWLEHAYRDLIVCIPTATMIKRIYMHINENMRCSDMPMSLLQSYLFLHAIVDVLQISSKVQRSSIIRMVPPRIQLASSHIFHLAGNASKMEYVRGCQSNSNRVPGLARGQPCHNRLFSEVQHEVFKGKKNNLRKKKNLCSADYLICVKKIICVALAFHEVQTCCNTLSSIPRIFSSVICLSGTCGVFFK